jgi:phage recombination protein Bet
VKTTGTKSPAQKQPAAQFSREQVELLKRTVCKGGSDDELRLFLNQCKRTGLDPFARQIFAIKRWDARERREVMATQVSIDGFRLIAARTGEYEGAEGPLWCGPDGAWRDAWLADEPPVASKVGVWRAGCRAPFWGLARFSEYVQTGRDGAPVGLWGRMPSAMLAKCAESLALRRAFPQELSGLYTSDELDHSASEAAPAARLEPGEPQPEPEAPVRPWRTFGQMVAEFSKLRGRLADDPAYYQILAEYGVRHSNEFKDARQAAAAYHQLLTRVWEHEAAASHPGDGSEIDTAELLEEIKPPEEEMPYAG